MVHGARRRLARSLGLMLLVVAGCASDGGADDQAVDGPITSSAEVDDEGGGSAPAPGTASTAAGAPPGASPDGSSPTADAPATATSIAPAPGPGEQAPAPGGVGAYAAFYLRPQQSAGLLVDVRSQAGAEPSAGTTEHLQRVLSQVSGKSVQIGGAAVGGGARDWSADDIRSLADSAGPAQSRDAAVIRLLFLRGGFAGDNTVLGVAVRSDVAAIFSDRISEAAGPLGNRSRIEDAITIHEVGHLLGLVDLVVDRGRADPEHPGHSRNRASVMYYAVESTLVGSILTGGPPTEFDADDLADLAAIRGG